MEMLSWYKWVAYKNGIGPEEFRKGQMRDWRAIIKIDNAINEKELRNAQIRKLMSQVRRR